MPAWEIVLFICAAEARSRCGRGTGAALGIEGRSQRSFCSALSTGNRKNLRQHDKGGSRLCCQSGPRNPPTPSSQDLPLQGGSPAESGSNRWLNRSEPIPQAAGVAEFGRRPGPGSSAHWVLVQGTEECTIFWPQTLPELDFDSFTTSLNSSCNHDFDTLQIAGAKSYVAPQAAKLSPRTDWWLVERSHHPIFPAVSGC